MKKLTGSRCQCGACGQYFNSVTAFDFHRTGEHGKDRRCMTEKELISRSYKLNSAGFWAKEGSYISE